ncbi:hypothetical protein Bhyg_03820 [Pseudolycoriella hygida]|uniref:DNA/RNA non-specific endonuclease domain-containing protein n=1 Tax=Pseudolycoriella hygida TaxID=35572 RepID=A0A9Q0S9N2_9DIPT|nr:hypothetical protein Bhyg_03820 [Pseudolycoriella hygida]
MKLFKFFTFFVVLIVISICASVCARPDDGKCIFTLPNDVPKNEPIYLNKQANNLTIFRPSGQVNRFSSNEKLHLFCPGKKNFIQIKGENVSLNSAEVVCNNRQFQINGFGNVNFSEVNCTKGVQTEIKIKRHKCSRTGRIIEVGFKMANNNFLETFKVCFENETLSPLWSNHIINGKFINFNVKERSRREFKATGFPSDASPSEAYKKTVQINHFKELIGIKQTVTYFSSTSYLARGHLTPDADFVFPSAQWSTYFYINASPQFQSVNSGNWLRVENLARKLAQSYNVDMEIWTGMYEILKLENSRGELEMMYLSANGKYPVPKWLWKIVKNTSTNSAIVFITLNDPYRSVDEVEEFCPNVCAKASVDTKHFKTMTQGYTFCCDLTDFRQVIRVLSPEATAHNLLSCSNIRLVA